MRWTLFVTHTMQYVTGSHMFTSRLTVHALVIEKNISPKSCQKRPFIAPAEKQRLVDTDAPVPQGQNDTLVRRSRACRDQSRPDGVGINGIGRLQFVQRFQQAFKRSAAQGFTGSRPFTGSKRRQALLLKHPLGFIAEQHRIAIKGNAQLA